MTPSSMLVSVINCYIIEIFLTFQGLSVAIMDACDTGLAPGQTATVTLSSDITTHLPAGETVRVAFTFYRDANLFPVRNSTMENGRTVVGSLVLSAQVDGIADGTELDSPVQLFFVLNNASVPGPNENALRRCAFWDFKAAGELVSCSSTLCILLLLILLYVPLHLCTPLLLFLLCLTYSSSPSSIPTCIRCSW